MMKICNTTACQTCESYESQSFKLLDYPCGIISPPERITDRLIFIISGVLSVKSDGQQEYICGKGRAILLTRDNKYIVNVLEGATLLVLSFVTSYQVCEKMKIKDAMEILNSVEYKFHSIEIREPMRIMIESALCYLKDGIQCNYWQKAKQIEFFVVYWNYYTLNEICNFFYPVINKDIGFHSKVMANYQKARSATELAELCGYSVATFNKLFVIHFQHSSPYKWMLRQNAPLIKARLFDKTVPIKVIIAEFGFSDHPHFNKYCNRYFGATALQVRSGND